jgi:carbonic anhydrase/acetyltransferase-like protein (isoleucine patch superfamily)
MTLLFYILFSMLRQRSHPMTNQDTGDHITIGDMSNVQGAAVGRNAQAHVTGNLTVGAAASIDPNALRAALKDLRTALGQANLPDDIVISTQTAAGTALMNGIKDDKVDSKTVVSNVQQIADTLKQTNVAVQEGSTLWASIQKLAPLLGPLVVGGAHIVAAWFGVPL